jgi:hypothetical protein
VPPSPLFRRFSSASATCFIDGQDSAKLKRFLEALSPKSGVMNDTRR